MKWKKKSSLFKTNSETFKKCKLPKKILLIKIERKDQEEQLTKLKEGLNAKLNFANVAMGLRVLCNSISN